MNLTDLMRNVEIIVNYFNREYPEAGCSLDFNTPIELLISTQLSAQCTDERVNIVSEALYKRFKTIEDFAYSDLHELESLIRPTGFFRNKAKNIKGCCIKLLEDFGGNIPDNMEDMLTLPGVGRKTANLVLGHIYGRPGIVVDTHVKRLSNRMGFTKEQDPFKIEKDLMELLPKDIWNLFCHQMILHGRAICNARKPKCDICEIRPKCEYGIKNLIV